jgi:hypothetical protein
MNLRRPGISRGGLIFHDRDCLLRGPVDEVFGGCVADGQIVPGIAPNHPEDMVRAQKQTRVAHQFFLTCDRLEKNPFLTAREGLPLQAIPAPSQMETIFFINEVGK